MKKLFLSAVVLLLVTAVPGFAQEVEMIKNPGHPPAKNAGRVVELAEVLRISDESGDFYFKRPWKIKAAPNGGFFVEDEDELLSFDKKGKFINNQFKKGQGPGEYTYIKDFCFLDNKIIIYTSQPYKIIETDLKGNLLKEQRIDLTMSFLRALGFFRGKYWFKGSNFDLFNTKDKGNIVIDHELSYVTLQGTIKKTSLNLPEKWYLERIIHKKAVGIKMNSPFSALFVMDGAGNLFVMNTQEYLVQRIELEKAKLVGKFSREYRSVPFREPEERKTKPIGSQLEYFADIQKILIRGDRLWLLTSTVTAGKGVLVDVFDRDGRYLDNFYLKLPQVVKTYDLLRKVLTLAGEFLFTVETAADENPVIVKYRIIDS